MAFRPNPILRAAAAALCGLSLAGPALASDAHADAKPAAPKKVEGKVDAHAEAKPAAKADAHAAPAAKADPKADAHAAPAAKPARAAETDPMDRLRERLAEKLGASKPHDAPSANVLRVVSKPSAAPEPRHAPSAATLAAAHRASKSPAAPEPAHGAGHAAAHAPHWSYAGAGGPQAWGELQPEFSKCSTGTRQSPIDIRDGLKLQLDPVQFDYRPSGFRVVDNGHTIQVNVSSGNSIEVLGRRYDLVQFHFHRPSEERIDGRQFDMVAHLVHKDLEGRLAVVAVLLERGSAQPLIQSVWNNLPLEKGDEVAARSPIDLNALLPAERAYFTYMGSLTTPPCSEGVLWMVMKKPVQVSSEQIGIFARLYPMNARPIQSAAGRTIKESN